MIELSQKRRDFLELNLILRRLAPRRNFENIHHDPHNGQFTSTDSKVSDNYLTGVANASINKANAAAAKGKSGKAADPVYHAYGHYWEAKQTHEQFAGTPGLVLPESVVEANKKMEMAKSAYQQIKKLHAAGKLTTLKHTPTPKASVINSMFPPPPPINPSPSKGLPAGHGFNIGDKVIHNKKGEGTVVGESSSGANSGIPSVDVKYKSGEQLHSMVKNLQKTNDTGLGPQGTTKMMASITKLPPPSPSKSDFSPIEAPSGPKAASVLPDKINNMGHGGAMVKQKTLGGSFNASLYEDGAGNKYVLKQGLNDAHTVNEHVANMGLRAAGVPAVASSIIDVGGKKTLIAPFVAGKTLADMQLGSQVEDSIKDHFVANVVFGNWDVFGMDNKNMMVDGVGSLHQIDNGGSLNFRARGSLKPAGTFGTKVNELTTMKDQAASELQKKIYSSITPKELAAQAEVLDAKKSLILKAMKSAGATHELAATVGARIDDAMAQTHKAPEVDISSLNHAGLKAAYAKSPNPKIGAKIIQTAPPGSMPNSDLLKYGSDTGHVSALKAFTGSSYSHINTAPDTDQSKKILEAYDALKPYHQPAGGSVIRALGFPNQVEREEFLDSLEDGGKKTLKRTLSSFTTHGHALGFGGGSHTIELHMHDSKTGRDIKFLSAHKGENEVVFKRGTKIKLQKGFEIPKDHSAHKMIIHVEEA